MRNVDLIQSVFDAHDGMMRTRDLSQEKNYYAETRN